ncbi:DUF4870 domain-containing protein [Acrocarpospora catenulata]|uniref:DUF4870 domain-containing protein n=1 Tax=Acrocarpospora catenulata TaxID=2836182 RepID=UPI001BDAB588|nr:DUF4870 domain-containing protein [Acrocarpospora catenulata]
MSETPPEPGRPSWESLSGPPTMPSGYKGPVPPPPPPPPAQPGYPVYPPPQSFPPPPPAPPPYYGPPQYGPSPGYYAPPPHVPFQYGPRPGSDDTTMAMLAHLLGLLSSFVGPLVMYLLKKDESPYVRDQAAEALNFQLTVLVASIVSSILMVIIIGIFLLMAVLLGGVILSIMGAVAANNGSPYRYPLSIRFVS